MNGNGRCRNIASAAPQTEEIKIANDILGFMVALSKKGMQFGEQTFRRYPRS